MNGAQQLTQAEQAEKVNAFLRAQGIETTVEDQIAAVAAQATRVAWLPPAAPGVQGDHRAVERLLTRLLATLVSATRPPQGAPERPASAAAPERAHVAQLPPAMQPLRLSGSQVALSPGLPRQIGRAHV